MSVKRRKKKARGTYIVRMRQGRRLNGLLGWLPGPHPLKRKQREEGIGKSAFEGPDAHALKETRYFSSPFPWPYILPLCSRCFIFIYTEIHLGSLKSYDTVYTRVTHMYLIRVLDMVDSNDNIRTMLIPLLG